MQPEQNQKELADRLDTERTPLLENIAKLREQFFPGLQDAWRIFHGNAKLSEELRQLTQKYVQEHPDVADAGTGALTAEGLSKLLESIHKRERTLEVVATRLQTGARQHMLKTRFTLGQQPPPPEGTRKALEQQMAIMQRDQINWTIWPRIIRRSLQTLDRVAVLYDRYNYPGLQRNGKLGESITKQVAALNIVMEQRIKAGIADDVDAINNTEKQINALLRTLPMDTNELYQDFLGRALMRNAELYREGQQAHPQLFPRLEGHQMELLLESNAFQMHTGMRMIRDLEIITLADDGRPSVIPPDDSRLPAPFIWQSDPAQQETLLKSHVTSIRGSFRRHFDEVLGRQEAGQPPREVPGLLDITWGMSAERLFTENGRTSMLRLCNSLAHYRGAIRYGAVEAIRIPLHTVFGLVPLGNAMVDRWVPPQQSPDEYRQKIMNPILRQLGLPDGFDFGSEAWEKLQKDPVARERFLKRMQGVATIVEKSSKEVRNAIEDYERDLAMLAELQTRISREHLVNAGIDEAWIKAHPIPPGVTMADIQALRPQDGPQILAAHVVLFRQMRRHWTSYTLTINTTAESILQDNVQVHLKTEQELKKAAEQMDKEDAQTGSWMLYAVFGAVAYVVSAETLGRIGRLGGIPGLGGSVGLAARVPGGGLLTLGRYNPLAILNAPTRLFVGPRSPGNVVTGTATPAPNAANGTSLSTGNPLAAANSPLRIETIQRATKMAEQFRHNNHLRNQLLEVRRLGTQATSVMRARYPNAANLLRDNPLLHSVIYGGMDVNQAINGVEAARMQLQSNLLNLLSGAEGQIGAVARGDIAQALLNRPLSIGRMGEEGMVTMIRQWRALGSLDGDAAIRLLDQAARTGVGEREVIQLVHAAGEDGFRVFMQGCHITDERVISELLRREGQSLISYIDSLPAAQKNALRARLPQLQAARQARIAEKARILRHAQALRIWRGGALAAETQLLMRSGVTGALEMTTANSLWISASNWASITKWGGRVFGVLGVAVEGYAIVNTQLQIEAQSKSNTQFRQGMRELLRIGQSGSAFTEQGGKFVHTQTGAEIDFDRLLQYGQQFLGQDYMQQAWNIGAFLSAVAMAFPPTFIIGALGSVITYIGRSGVEEERARDMMALIGDLPKEFMALPIPGLVRAGATNYSVYRMIGEQQIRAEGRVTQQFLGMSGFELQNDPDFQRLPQSMRKTVIDAQAEYARCIETKRRVLYSCAIQELRSIGCLPMLHQVHWDGTETHATDVIWRDLAQIEGLMWGFLPARSPLRAAVLGLYSDEELATAMRQAAVLYARRTLMERYRENSRFLLGHQESMKRLGDGINQYIASGPSLPATSAPLTPELRKLAAPLLRYRSPDTTSRDATTAGIEEVLEFLTPPQLQEAVRFASSGGDRYSAVPRVLQALPDVTLRYRLLLILATPTPPGRREAVLKVIEDMGGWQMFAPGQLQDMQDMNTVIGSMAPGGWRYTIHDMAQLGDLAPAGLERGTLNDTPRFSESQIKQFNESFTAPETNYPQQERAGAMILQSWVNQYNNSRPTSEPSLAFTQERTTITITGSGTSRVATRAVTSPDQQGTDAFCITSGEHKVFFRYEGGRWYFSTPAAPEWRENSAGRFPNGSIPDGIRALFIIASRKLVDGLSGMQQLPNEFHPFAEQVKSLGDFRLAIRGSSKEEMYGLTVHTLPGSPAQYVNFRGRWYYTPNAAMPWTSVLSGNAPQDIRQVVDELKAIEERLDPRAAFREDLVRRGATTATEDIGTLEGAGDVPGRGTVYTLNLNNGRSAPLANSMTLRFLWHDGRAYLKMGTALIGSQPWQRLDGHPWRSSLLFRDSNNSREYVTKALEEISGLVGGFANTPRVVAYNPRLDLANVVATPLTGGAEPIMAGVAPDLRSRLYPGNAAAPTVLAYGTAIPDGTNPHFAAAQETIRTGAPNPQVVIVGTRTFTESGVTYEAVITTAVYSRDINQNENGRIPYTYAHHAAIRVQGSSGPFLALPSLGSLPSPQFENQIQVGLMQHRQAVNAQREEKIRKEIGPSGVFFRAMMANDGVTTVISPTEFAVRTGDTGMLITLRNGRMEVRSFQIQNVTARGNELDEAFLSALTRVPGTAIAELGPQQRKQAEEMYKQVQARPEEPNAAFLLGQIDSPITPDALIANVLPQLRGIGPNGREHMQKALVEYLQRHRGNSQNGSIGYQMALSNAAINVMNARADMPGIPPVTDVATASQAVYAIEQSMLGFGTGGIQLQAPIRGQ